MLLQQLSTDPIYVLRFIVIIIISITLHELGHGAAAISQGDSTPNDTGHMTLNPVIHMGWVSLIALCFVGIAWGSMPVNPRKFKDGAIGKILVAAAGPMTNIAIAMFCIVVINLLHSSTRHLISLDFFRLAALINIGLGLFNLLPYSASRRVYSVERILFPASNVSKTTRVLPSFWSFYLSQAPSN